MSHGFPVIDTHRTWLDPSLSTYYINGDDPETFKGVLVAEIEIDFTDPETSSSQPQRTDSLVTSFNYYVQDILAPSNENCYFYSFSSTHTATANSVCINPDAEIITQCINRIITFQPFITVFPDTTLSSTSSNHLPESTDVITVDLIDIQNSYIPSKIGPFTPYFFVDSGPPRSLIVLSTFKSFNP